MAVLGYVVSVIVGTSTIHSGMALFHVPVSVLAQRYDLPWVFLLGLVYFKAGLPDIHSILQEFMDFFRQGLTFDFGGLGSNTLVF
jgi:hypothetical protein